MHLHSLHARATRDSRSAVSRRSADGAARHRQIYERGSHAGAARAALADPSPLVGDQRTTWWRKAARHAKPVRPVRATVRRMGTLPAAVRSPLTNSRAWGAGL